MSDSKEILYQWIKESNNIVFFGGAGVSTESNIPDFRSVDGLYHQTYDYPPETILSHSFYQRNTKAGSKEVLELHGSVLRNYCTRCGKFYSLEDLVPEGVPKCECGGTIKPDVVLYEEGLDSHTLNKAVHYIQQADMLIIGGTSLAVYPAAGLIDYYSGHKLVLINRDETPRDNIADLVLHESIGQVLAPFTTE